ncbi:GGDEF domain-containing protein [uncultured Treponema sp.]|uniref:GGDEF domain-containing protein n=1 Tax=uncultured Treponema sp. TaxID=162155 RepID=UPI0025EAB103|nr:GGDEF domain-containing protein [uncultured Treponema sp.]
MKKRTDGLLFKFALIFSIFTAFALLSSGLATYFSQMKSYKAQCLYTVKKIGDYLEHLIQESGEDFIKYQEYYMKHFAEADIPYNFTEYLTAQREYERLLAQTQSPDDGENHTGFNSLSEEVRMAYFVYIHEYWLLTFENARKAFSLPYTYYLVPKENIYNMVYMIDGERSHKGFDGKKAMEGKYLYLGDEYHDDYDKYRVQWDTWFTGQKQNSFQVWNNDWGHTYAFYTPLIINGQKLGLIGTEIEVKDVNKAILQNTFVQTSAVGIVLVVCIGLMLFFINTRYIKKIIRLEANLQQYTREKNPDIASKIEAETSGKNEISSLYRQSAHLILEIENYIKNLFATAQKLKITQEQAEKMDVLANRDPLTGIRNKNAYDSEVRNIEWKMQDGFKEFGIVMIDLNFLKKINDTFGHEQGNVTIKKLSAITCKIFKNSPVFRIGGDEFVVIIEGEDFKNIEMRVLDFNMRIDGLSRNEDLEPWERVSAALGYALYDREVDSNVLNVFRRADKAMYARKKEMKAVRED